MTRLLFVDLDRDWAIPLLKQALGNLADDSRFDSRSLNDTLAQLDRTELQDVEVVSPFISSAMSHTQLDRLPSLRLIATRSTGFDHIDTSEASRRGVTVCNVPMYGDNTVAEHTFALILSLSRKLRQTYERVRRAEFDLVDLEGFDLRGKTLGVVGTGHIGVRVIQIARGFSMQVLASDPRPQPLLADVLNFQYCSFEELLRRSDIVSLHAPQTAATRHMINAQSLGLMKKGAVLINTSRGGLVDTDALEQALRSGQLGGAGLDVLEYEATLIDEDHARARLHDVESMRAALVNQLVVRRDDVIFTPHVAFNSREANERILRTTADNVRAFYEGRAINVVAKP